MGKLLTPAQVADILQIKLKTVYLRLDQGKIKGSKIGDLWRIEESDLKEFIEAGKRSEVRARAS